MLKNEPHQVLVPIVSSCETLGKFFQVLGPWFHGMVASEASSSCLCEAECPGQFQGLVPEREYSQAVGKLLHDGWHAGESQNGQHSEGQLWREVEPEGPALVPRGVEAGSCISWRGVFGEIP